MNSELKIDSLKTNIIYCINPKCNNPKNNFNSVLCEECGSQLLLDGQYRTTAKLSDNGFISTYEVDDNGQEKILKVLYNYTEDNLNIFKKQIEILSQNTELPIANIIFNSYFHFFPNKVDTSLHCVLTQKINGQTLTQWMENKESLIRDTLALNWFLQLTQIIRKLHSKDIIHGNINPNNIMITPSGELILISLPSLPNVFTKAYTSREQQEGFLLPQSDFFALGRTFVYVLTQKHPLESYDAYQDEINWRQFNPNVNERLADYIDILIKPFAKNRPETINAITRRLREIEILLKTNKTENIVEIEAPKPPVAIENKFSDNEIESPSPLKRKHRKRKKPKTFLQRSVIKFANFMQKYYFLIAMSILFGFIIVTIILH